MIRSGLFKYQGHLPYNRQVLRMKMYKLLVENRMAAGNRAHHFNKCLFDISRMT